jgi:glutamine cyclotransferase
MNHDPNSFCQGLVKYKNFLFESSGAYLQRSYIIKYDMRTGVILATYKFTNNDFAEGITIMNNQLICVTWKNQRIYYFDLELKLIKINTFPFTECWGLTNNSTSLIMTDGSNKIRFVSPNTYKVTRPITVDYIMLNAVCYTNKHIYVNIWKTNKIIKINVVSGKITREFDLSDIAEKFTNNEFCLNGITTSGIRDMFIVTGKRWKKFYNYMLTI